MSRIGLRPIELPKNVTVTVENNHVKVKGPKGELEQAISNLLTVEVEESEIKVARSDNNRHSRSQHGLARTLIANMVHGVSQGHQKALEIHGVGYRAQAMGKNLQLNLGYSHPIMVEPPAGVEFEIQPDDKKKVTTILVRGINKAEVGQVAADIRKARKPDPYKGKGVRYQGEVVRLRQGKRATK
ncbi:MAG: 50S ribosomal protein L6 [Fimbriimonadaceae bacterium]|nr:50S ribosomal protein L6 [Fimbriimonadaceae bacterium]